jgi:hypothetical protein
MSGVSFGSMRVTLCEQDIENRITIKRAKAFTDLIFFILND